MQLSEISISIDHFLDRTYLKIRKSAFDPVEPKTKGVVMHRLFLLLTIVVVLFSSNSIASNLPSHEGYKTPKLIRAIKSFLGTLELSITVLDQDGAPLDEALVMIGEAPGNPFKDNIEYTDQDGKVVFDSSQITAPFTVTAYKEGFNAYSIFDIDSDQTTINLTPLESHFDYAEIHGGVSQWQQMANGDDIFAASFVTPLLFFDEVVNFSLNSLLGPECSMDIYGQRDVPCNLVIPPQTESYLFFPVALNKPDYRLRAKKDGPQDFLALSGDIPFTSTVDLLLGGGSFEGVLDSLLVKKVSLNLNKTIHDGDEVNMPLQHNIRANQIDVEVKNRPLNRSMILISLANLDKLSEQFIPTGIRVIGRRDGFRRKQLGSVLKEGRLKDSVDIVVAVAADLPENKDDKDNDSKLIGIISHRTDNPVQIDSFFLPLELSLTTSSIDLSDVFNPGISPAPNVNFVSLRREIKNKATGNIDETIWTVIAPSAHKSIKLPQLPIQIIPDIGTTPENDKLYWSAGVFSLDQGSTMFDYNLLSAQRFADNLTHFSWNKIEVARDANTR